MAAVIDFFVDRLDNRAAAVAAGDNIGGIPITYPDDAKDDKPKADKPKEPTKADVIKIIKDYMAKDVSISSDLAKLALEDDDRVMSRAKEITLEHRAKLKGFLTDLRMADTSGEVQEIINDLTTIPAAAKEEPDAPAPVKKDPEPIKLNDMLVYEYIERHPELMKKLERAKANMRVPTVPIYFRKDDIDKEEPLPEEAIKAKVFLRFDGDFDAACGPEGFYTREYRIADSEGNPTEAIYSEDNPKKGKS